MIEEVQLYKPRKPLKRPVRKILKRKRGKTRKAKNPLKKARTELWELCKQITRKRYGNTCYTCEARDLAAGNWHTGHFLPRSTCGLHLRYDLRNLRPQCYRCNISLVGNGAIFYRNMVRRENQEYVDCVFAEKGTPMKENLNFYETKIAEYKLILSSLTGGQ